MLSLDTNREQDLFLFQEIFQRNRFPFAQIKPFTVLESTNTSFRLVDITANTSTWHKVTLGVVSLFFGHGGISNDF